MLESFSITLIYLLPSLKCWLLRPWTSYGLGRRRSRPDPIPGPGRPPARPAVETHGTYEHIVQVAGRGRGKALRPQWATGSEGVQAGQDLAWGHSGGPDPGTGPGACLFSKPGTDAWVARTSAVQSTIPSSYNPTDVPQSPYPPLPIFLLIKLYIHPSLYSLYPPRLLNIRPQYQKSPSPLAPCLPLSTPCSGPPPVLSRCLSSRRGSSYPGCGPLSEP